MSEWFTINDIDEFTDKARTIVYNNFGMGSDDPSKIDQSIDTIASDERDELDNILSHAESISIIKNIVKTQINKKTKEIRYILSDKLFLKILDDLNARMVSNILTGLVKKGLVESAFDSETNDFIFWVKDDEDETSKNNQPETD